MTAKPKSITAVFLLTMSKIVLATGFFGIALMTHALPATPTKIGLTLAAYVALAIPTFVSIHRRSAKGTRAFIVLAILASLPAGAAIGILLDSIALVLTFRAPAKRFFAKQ